MTAHQTPAGEDTVQPFVISFSEVQSAYEKGKPLFFDLIIIGRKGVSFCKQIVLSLAHWEQMELGRFQFLTHNPFRTASVNIRAGKIDAPAGRLKLAHVEQVLLRENHSLVNLQGNWVNLPEPQFFSFDPAYLPSQTDYRIRFVSPCRLERKIQNMKTGVKGRKKRITPDLFTLDILAKSLKTRFCGLMTHFSDSCGQSDFIEIIKTYTDDSTRMNEKQLEMDKIIRVNPRTNIYKHFDGFIGEIKLSQVHSYTAQLISFAGIFHIGKFVTFGYGIMHTNSLKKN